jgi:hypothetical protein
VTAIERLAGWLWDQIPTHHQIKFPGRVFNWFEGQAWNRDWTRRGEKRAS